MDAKVTYYINSKILEALLALTLSGAPSTGSDGNSQDLDSGSTLNEIVVTAGESAGLTSSSKIGRSAMQHLQPTSFSDLLELLPGNISRTPDMASANTITLRETGNITASGTKSSNEDYAITSLGTLFMVDGSPINTDANMRGIPGATAGEPEGKREITNRGVDMRSISTDNIESVEIVRGIPSAEYGNLTSGLVNIKRINRPTPFVARFKADGFSKLFSLAKGFEIGENTLINLDGGYLDSKADPRDNLENYRRLNFSARSNIRFPGEKIEANLTIGGDYTGSFDNAKTDPDLNYNKIDEYNSRFNRMAITSTLRLTPLSVKWLSQISLNGSLSYQIDRVKRRKQVAPRHASVAPTSMEEGVQEGHYLLSEYISDFISDGKPLNSFIKLTADGEVHTGNATHSYKAGGEWSISKNLGKGQVYELTRPLSASWTTRPWDYSEIPALHNLSLFGEEKLTYAYNGNLAELQAGIRLAMLPRLDSRYYLSNRVYADPRINAVWNFPFFNAGKRKIRLLAAAGFGYTTKMPTIDYLYPQVSYTDFIELNYYDVGKPEENSRVVLRTYINDPVNNDLQPARNLKWEVRGGGSWGESGFSVTYFRERMRSGFRYNTEYAPFEYTKYDESHIDASGLTGPPDINAIPSELRQVLSGTRRVTNGSRLDKEGVEFQLTTPRWKALGTSLTVTGAWFRSTYSNSQMMFATVNDVVDNHPVNERYVGLYNSDDGRRNSRFNTNFMFDTRITKWGLMFTTTLQCMWYESTETLRRNGIPDYYISAEDGELHPFTEEDMEDPMLRYLVKRYNDDAFRKQTIPPALYLNLKATKKIGNWLRISAFVNNIINYLPDFKSNGMLVRRVADTYFGAEINISI